MTPTSGPEVCIFLNLLWDIWTSRVAPVVNVLSSIVIAIIIAVTAAAMTVIN